MAVETLGLDGLQALGLLLMGEQQAARLGQSFPTLLCLLNSQCLHNSLTLTLTLTLALTLTLTIVISGTVTACITRSQPQPQSQSQSQSHT